jgi:hypothetical protein
LQEHDRQIARPPGPVKRQAVYLCAARAAARVKIPDISPSDEMMHRHTVLMSALPGTCFQRFCSSNHGNRDIVMYVTILAIMKANGAMLRVHFVQ